MSVSQQTSSSEEDRGDSSSDSDFAEVADGANADELPAILPSVEREIRPYRFEPEVADDDEDEDEEDTDFLDDREDIERRLGNRDW